MSKVQLTFKTDPLIAESLLNIAMILMDEPVTMGECLNNIAFILAELPDTSDDVSELIVQAHDLLLKASRIERGLPPIVGDPVEP